ncbi:hypothetical protein L7F22_043256 [Adiantum nelumboides]|nr:hypothetical protein [Adiantum nelumboides]MCO5589290.1 hypothetical protein [Adiantum nelumboides]
MAVRAAVAMMAVVTVVVLLLQAWGCRASDPELTQDFLLPEGVNASGDFFTYTGFRAGPQAAPGMFKALKAPAEAFPALAGLGVSAALLEYQPGSQNTPHTHPRGTELLFLLDGSLIVGLVDSAGNFFNQTLQRGDLFVFPKGLVHFQVNPSSSKTAMAIASFSSSSPGTVSLPSTLFGSGIPSSVLAQAFSVDENALSELEGPFSHT